LWPGLSRGHALWQTLHCLPHGRRLRSGGRWRNRPDGRSGSSERIARRAGPDTPRRGPGAAPWTPGVRTSPRAGRLRAFSETAPEPPGAAPSRVPPGNRGGEFSNPVTALHAMNILHIIPGLTWERGGPAAVVHALARHQAEAGHQVRVLATVPAARHGER